MPAITHHNYKLPKIFALSYQQTFNSGVNAPILVRGLNMATQQKSDYVVKLKASERMKEPSANLRELLAAHIAMQMDIPVAEPVLVEISDELAETIHEPMLKSRLQQSIGTNFGTVYRDGYSTFVPGLLSDKLLPFAQDLFAFDMFIQNADRNNEKPNMLINDEEILAIDHELAFSFIFAPFISANLWEMQEHQKKWVRDHILYSFIKGKRYDFNAFEEKCLTLGTPFWDRALQLTPYEWRTAHFDTIKGHLQAFVENRISFIHKLQTIMS